MFKKISEKLNVMCDFPTLFFVLAPFSFFLSDRKCVQEKNRVILTLPVWKGLIDEKVSDMSFV
jgi:hypothetical protein